MTLQIGYITLSVVVLVLLLLIGNHAINKSVKDEKVRTRYKRVLILVMLLWQVYLIIMGTSGFLASFSLPPRMPLLIIVPLFISMGVFLNKNKNKQWIQSIPPIWLTAFQSFRIVVETLFVLSLPTGVLHENVTIEGYNYDMVVGISAPIIALMVYYSKKLPNKLLTAWNIFGLTVLACTVFVFMSTAFFPQIYGFETTPLSTDFGMYPYVLVPGLLMPAAVFMHVLSLIQLRSFKRTTSHNPA